ncbi:MAG TPA: TraR/DksA C4-type zinc finger protein [Ktedonobacterales bacterium]
MAEIDPQRARERLMAERTRLQEDIYSRTQGDQAVAPVDPLLDSGGISSHQADNADAASEFERNQAIIANSREMLQQVEAALSRVDAGTYGICARCGQPIEPRRLEALPYVALCLKCQEAVEQEGQG